MENKDDAIFKEIKKGFEQIAERYYALEKRIDDLEKALKIKVEYYEQREKVYS